MASRRHAVEPVERADISAAIVSHLAARGLHDVEAASVEYALAYTREREASPDRNEFPGVASFVAKRADGTYVSGRMEGALVEPTASPGLIGAHQRTFDIRELRLFPASAFSQAELASQHEQLQEMRRAGPLSAPTPGAQRARPGTKAALRPFALTNFHLDVERGLALLGVKDTLGELEVREHRAPADRFRFSARLPREGMRIDAEGTTFVTRGALSTGPVSIHKRDSLPTPRPRTRSAAGPARRGP